jgi:uncharacterized protein YndB with AHSA1/START domain
VTESTPDAEAIRIERTINAPRRVVFDAWLTPEVLRRWWPAGSDWETPVAEVDPRVGGRMRLVMRSPEGEEFGGSGVYTQITPPSGSSSPGPGTGTRATRVSSASRSCSEIAAMTPPT